MAWFKKRTLPESQTVSLLARGEIINVTLKWHARARRMILRPNTKGDGATVTLPIGVNAESGVEFARERSDWLADQFAKHDKPVEFSVGVTVPFRGQIHEIGPMMTGRGRGTVVQEGGMLLVSGKTEHLARRLTDWFKKQARETITRLADEKTAALGQSRGRISIRDTRSRWGSCSSTGSLNFSWRLILAPDWVLDYVVAHEVAHLIEHNHSPAFWAIVDTLTDHRKGAQKWLRDHGSRLHRYG